MPKAAGRSVAVCETTSHRKEAVADGVGRCLVFLVGFVNFKKKTAPLGATKFAKVYVQSIVLCCSLVLEYVLFP